MKFSTARAPLLQSGAAWKVLCFAIVFLSSLPVFLYYFFLNPPFYWPNFIDMHYYSAVADSIFSGQGFSDLTQDPKNLVTSAQNGIVFVHLVLMKAGLLDQESRLAAIMLLHYFLLFLSSLIIYRIFSFFKIKPALILVSVGIFIFSNQFFRTLIVPINEGGFFFLSMLLIYLVLVYDRKPKISNLLLIAAVSMVIPHFRNQGILIPLCAAAVSAYEKEWKKSSVFFLVFLLSYLSIHVFYTSFMSDLTGIRQFADDIVKHSLQNNFSLAGMIKPFTVALPVMFLGFGQDAYSGLVWYTFPIFVFLFLFLLRIFIKVLRERNFAETFLMLFIFTNLLLLYLSPVFSFRYIIATFPIIILILAQRFQAVPVFRSLLIVYCAYAFFLTGYRIVYVDSIFENNAVSTRNVISRIPKDAVLISDDRTTSYFLFNKRSCLDCAALHGAKHILVFGDLPYVEDQIKRLGTKDLVSRVDFYKESWIMNPYRLPYRLAVVQTRFSERAGREDL